MRYLVIPAYEPDEKLLKLLKDLQSYQSLTIVVVNDGSTSSYNPIFQAASQFSTVLCHKENYGKGRALKTAFSYITNIKNTLGEGIVITADSDGQHTPYDIFKVGKACEDNPNTLITGERYFTGNVPFRSRFGNTITKYVFSLSTGLSLKDTQCGLRAFSTELLPFLCSIKGERYEYEMNVLLEGAKKFHPSQNNLILLILILILIAIQIQIRILTAVHKILQSQTHSIKMTTFKSH